MLLTPHTIVGVAIASTIPNPYIAVPTAFAFHFLGDLVPHWDYCRLSNNDILDKYYPLKIMADLSLGIGFGMFFTLYTLFVMNNPTFAVNIFLCGIFSVLPDAIVAPVMFNSEVKGLPKLMFNFQRIMHIQIPLPWGLISQIVVSAVCLLLILNSTVLS
jgi:hypothetical protein